MQAIKKQAFELAIQSDETPSKEQDPSEIEVEPSYTGPRMEDGAGLCFACGVALCAVRTV